MFDALYHDGSSHTFVFADEAGELYFRGLEECLRPLLTADNITTYGTAQNFHSKKRRTDTIEEDRDRLRAFPRKFPMVIELRRPADDVWWTPLSRPETGDSSLLLAGSVA